MLVYKILHLEENKIGYILIRLHIDKKSAIPCHSMDYIELIFGKIYHTGIYMYAYLYYVAVDYNCLALSANATYSNAYINYVLM